MEQIIEAIKAISKQKEIPEEVLFDSIEAALLTAYKKHFRDNRKARVEINRQTGKILIFSRYTVVEEVKNDQLEISINDAKKINIDFEVDDIVEIEEAPKDFGRISALAAKQVVVQRIKEAERDTAYNEYKNRENELLYSRIQRISGTTVFFNLGKVEAMLPSKEQARGERYRVGDRIRTYISEVKEGAKAPEITLSRTHPGLVRRLFEMEVPEILEGDVLIKSISREAGSRTKISVMANGVDIDPVGACVGNKGSRVNSIVEEINGEKIDIVTYTDDIEKYVENALSPAKVSKVIKLEDKSVLVVVPDYQLSLAIGKEGQNARLAAKLTGVKIDIVSESQYEKTNEKEMKDVVSNEEA